METFVIETQQFKEAEMFQNEPNLPKIFSSLKEYIKWFRILFFQYKIDLNPIINSLRDQKAFSLYKTLMFYHPPTPLRRV